MSSDMFFFRTENTLISYFSKLTGIRQTPTPRLIGVQSTSHMAGLRLSRSLDLEATDSLFLPVRFLLYLCLPSPSAKPLHHRRRHPNLVQSTIAVSPHETAGNIRQRAAVSDYEARRETKLHHVLSEDRFLCHLVVTERENHDRRLFLILPRCCAAVHRRLPTALGR